MRACDPLLQYDGAGAVLAVNAYDEYGMPDFGALANQRFGYTGQMWLPEAGVHHYVFRAYAQHYGRFLQPDPIGYDGDGPNLYAYVLNDPINLVDPLGLACMTGSRICPSDADGSGGGGGIAPTYSGISLIGAGGNDLSMRWKRVQVGGFVTGGAPGTPIVVTAITALVPVDFGSALSVFGRVSGGGRGFEAGNRAASGGGAPSAAGPAEPGFCRNELYRVLDELDRLAGYGQAIALGVGIVGQTEQYAAMRAAARAGAVSAYFTIGKIRFALNVGKALLGDYRGSITDIGLRTVGRAAGADELGQVIGGELGQAIARKVSGSPCR